MRTPVVLAAVLLGLCFCGCREPSMSTVAENARKQEAYKTRKILTPQNRKKPGRSRPAQQAEVDLIERAYQAGRSTSFGIGPPEDVAVRKVFKAIEASLELGPTLVVWIFDRTASSQKLTSQAITAAVQEYDSPEGRRLTLAEEQRFLTSVVAYDEKIDFVLDPPGDDVQQIKAALQSIAAAEGGKELTFTAVQQALDKFQSLRTTERREVLLVLVTDEVGDDQHLCDELGSRMEKAAIPLYVIGSPAPWGQANPFLPNIDPKQPKVDDAAPTHGPESLFSERVNFSMWPATGFNSSPVEQNLIDSGFGPFALEKLCRASGGEFMIVRPAGNEAYSYRGVGYDFWPSGRELRFEPDVVKRYAPDYVSEAEYKQLLAENKARMTLHEAAKLPPTKIEDYPELRFQKGTEAQTVQRLNRAQQFAARHAPAIDRLYDILQPGEADREKLSSPRWQAEYDFAMGRIAAAKVRVDGYNAMIASLKRGKTFQNANSREWVLEPSETIETGSTQQNLARKAHMYLDRLVKHHAGTPWAKIAAEEQKVPLGWQWREE